MNKASNTNLKSHAILKFLKWGGLVAGNFWYPKRMDKYCTKYLLGLLVPGEGYNRVSPIQKSGMLKLCQPVMYEGQNIFCCCVYCSRMHVTALHTWVIESGLNLVFRCCGLVRRNDTGSCTSLVLSTTVICRCLSIHWTLEQLVVVIQWFISWLAQTHAQLGVTVRMLYTCARICCTGLQLPFASTWQCKVKQYKMQSKDLDCFKSLMDIKKVS